MTPETTQAMKILSAKLGLTTKVGKATRGIHLHKAAPLPKPGSHTALLRRMAEGIDHADAR